MFQQTFQKESKFSLLEGDSAEPIMAGKTAERVLSVFITEFDRLPG